MAAPEDSPELWGGGADPPAGFEWRRGGFVVAAGREGWETAMPRWRRGARAPGPVLAPGSGLNGALRGAAAPVARGSKRRLRISRHSGSAAQRRNPSRSCALYSAFVGCVSRRSSPVIRSSRLIPSLFRRISCCWNLLTVRAIQTTPPRAIAIIKPTITPATTS